MSSPAAASATSPYAGHRFPAEVINHAIWLYFRFPLSLRMVEEMLAARGIVVSHGRAAKRIDGRQWALRFGQEFANRIRRRLPCAGDKWHLDEVVILLAKSPGYMAVHTAAGNRGAIVTSKRRNLTERSQMTQP